MAQTEAAAGNFVDRIQWQASEVRVSRLLLSIPAVIFMALGFIVGLACAGIVWCYLGTREGYRMAKSKYTDAAS
jgi:hypothetical protein